MTDLDRLIEAVEEGRDEDVSDICRRLSSAHRDKGEYWPGDDICKACRKSLDAAVAVKDVLLWRWDFRLEVRDNDAFARVFEAGQKYDFTDEWELDSDRDIARALLLATLKAYRERMKG